MKKELMETVQQTIILPTYLFAPSTAIITSISVDFSTAAIVSTPSIYDKPAADDAVEDKEDDIDKVITVGGEGETEYTGEYHLNNYFCFTEEKLIKRELT